MFCLISKYTGGVIRCQLINTYRRFERSYYLPRPVALLWLLLGITTLRSVGNCQLASRKGRYTLSVKLNDFTVGSHTWRKNWVNCAVLTGNSAGLRTVLSSRLSLRELRSSLRESHSFLSLPVLIHHSHTHKTHRSDKKLTNLMGNLCCAREHSVQLFVQYFTQLNCTV